MAISKGKVPLDATESFPVIEHRIAGRQRIRTKLGSLNHPTNPWVRLSIKCFLKTDNAAQHARNPGSNV